MAERAPKPIPDGMNTITTHLWFSGNCSEAIEFYKKAFDAELVGEAFPTPDGKGIMHAMLHFGDSNIMMADEFPDVWEQGPRENATAGMFLYVEDCDAVYNKAVKAGCEIMVPMDDAFWGDRFGKIKDPFGHTWAIATHKWIYTPEEMEQKQKEMIEKEGS
jgi:uncharacterized glyoxalase superfamily protein PhnB